MLLKSIAGAALASALLFAAPASAAVNLVTNGSFESGTDPGSFTTVTGSAAITGWTISEGNVDYIGSYWQAAAGSRSIAMNGYFSNGMLSQTVNGLIAGNRYTLSFAIAGNTDGAPSVKNLGFSVGAFSGVASFDDTGLSRPDNMGWSTRSYTFTASGSSALLTFQSTDVGGAYGPALDNVSLSAAVPEPSTWALMLLGFAGLSYLGMARRRAVKAVA